MLNANKPLIARQNYLEKLIAFKDKEVIKIITGIRRCGKSTLLKLFESYLLEQGIEQEQIIKINFEDFFYRQLQDPQTLHDYILQNIIPDKMNYVLLDEIQNVKDFPSVINSLALRENIDLYLTGSNAYMLSSEIATFISGRYIEVKMLPLSFKEFVSTDKNNTPLATLYRKYLEIGSFPYLLELQGNNEETRDYLEGLYNTVIVKDIINRNGISDPLILKNVVEFVFDNIGNELSSKKIADTMTSAGRKIDARTVEKYLNALVESFIVYQAKRYNIKGRQYLRNNEKYYAVDMALRSMLLGQKAMDVGHILENIVYLELKRRGYEVYVGKIDNVEVDFVAINHQGTAYFQVAATVRDEVTLSRELNSLERIKDSHPKYLLTLDEDPIANHNGIKRMNALEWLLE